MKSIKEKAEDYGYTNWQSEEYHDGASEGLPFDAIGHTQKTFEAKELLLKDLCARVPYHPKGRVVNACNGSMCDEWLTCATFPMFTNIINNCRLYLRPMSSMTEEEEKEFQEIKLSYHFDEDGYILFDWLNAHHFDYRGLIERNLALEAPVDMYNLKEK